MKKTLFVIAAVLLPGGLIVAGLWWYLAQQPQPTAKKGGQPQ